MSNDKDKLSKKEIRKKIKDDKIFNNGYKAGEGLKGDGEYQYFSSISVTSSYSDSYLKDIYEYEDTLEYNIGVGNIFNLIDSDSELSALLKKADHSDKIKLSKEEINWCFTRILSGMEKTLEVEKFYNPIYVLEVISSILNINSGDSIKSYKKIFDCLDVELQQDLIVELDKKYNFLDGKLNKRRIH
tara:strand:- start:150 stop:710 length:561 start_codon:yes stop_codon:yes gene_type:complete